MPEVIEAIAAARAAAGLPPVQVDLHPDHPDQRAIRIPNGTYSPLPAEPTFTEIEAAGGRVVKHAEAQALAGGSIYGSGHIA